MCYDLENNSWFQPEIDEPKPQGRYGQTQIVLNEHNLLIIGKTKTVSICELVFILTLLIVKKKVVVGDRTACLTTSGCSAWKVRILVLFHIEY